MEGLSRWLCSFYADKVRIRQYLKLGSTITYGERVLLCTIELTGSNSAFKDYHENKITVVNEASKPATSQDCTVNIEKVNCHELCVYFTAWRTGKAVVKIDLGKWYLFEDKSDEKILLDVLPSPPEHLVVSQLGYVAKPLDDEFKARISTNSSWELYIDQESVLKFHLKDKLKRVIVQIKNKRSFDVTIDGHSYFNHLNWEITNEGTIVARFWPKKVGETKLMVQLVDKRSNSKHCFPVPVNIIHTPFSPQLTLEFFQKFKYDNIPKESTAGKDFTFEMKLYDIFGYPMRHDTTALWNVDVDLFALIPGEPTEIASTEKITSGNSAAVVVKVGFRLAGDKYITVAVNPFSQRPSFETICVKVLPSTPNALTHVRFRPQSPTVDKGFWPDSSVVYCNQWSFLEASIIDAYSNVIQSCEEYDISLELSNGIDSGMEYSTEEEFENVTFRALIKLKEIGSADLLIKLTNKTNPSHEVYSLKEVQVRVVHAPICLARSEFTCPYIFTAGEEAELELLHPFDVFGCPFPTNSTSYCNLDAETVNNPLAELNEPQKTIEFKVKKTESKVRRYFSIVLTKTGVRWLNILNKDTDDTKMLNICVKPDLKNTHWELLSHPRDSVVGTKRLEYTVGLFDRFDNEVPRRTSIESIPYPVKLAGPDDGMRCAGTLSQIDEGNEVTISYHFTESGSCTIRLAPRDSNDSWATISTSVQDAPLDSYYSSVEWSPKYKDIPNQPVFQDDESFQCCLKLKDIADRDFDEKIDKRSVKVKYDKTEVKPVKVSSSANKIGCYTAVVPLKDVLKDHDPNPKFWFFVDGIQLKKALVFPRYENFQKYNDDACTIGFPSSIHCYGVKRSDIIGEDYMYLNNIKRVCKLQEDPKVQERITMQRTVTVIELPEECKVHECRDLLLHLLRATYYRNQAFKADRCREEWKEKANEYYKKYKKGKNVDSNSPTLCRQIKEKYAKLMASYHNAACEEFFKFFNADRGQSEIDLHGLLVVDEKKLQEYERQLRSKGQMSNAKIKKRIDEERDRSNEAIRKLRERLEICDMSMETTEEPWLEIIVGAGNHSKERQQIRPKIEKYLEKANLAFFPVNKGALVVTFQKYSGPEPCFGEYYCTNCGKIWKSSRSWVDQWQACYKCHENKALLVKCFPLKQRPKRKRLCHRPISKRPTEKIPHLPELCAKCIELGYECPEPLK